MKLIDQICENMKGLFVDDWTNVSVCYRCYSFTFAHSEFEDMHTGDGPVCPLCVEEILYSTTLDVDRDEDDEDGLVADDY